MAFPLLHLLNGTLYQCDALPDVYPCLNTSYSCWANSSNCWGGLYDIGAKIGYVIPSEYCNVTICPLDTFRQAHFSYLPTLAGNSLFAAIFALLLLLQIGMAIRWRTWTFLVGMVGGLVLEVIGYVGRIMMNSSPFAQNPFLIYLICLTIAPAFLSASIYICLGRVVVAYGERLSRFRPKTYTLTFVSCDFISLVLQGAGGGLAATANTDSELNTGTNIMIAGLAFQVFSLLLFMLLSAEFLLRVKSASYRNPDFASTRHTVRFPSFIYALGIATLAIFARCVYRVAELSKGFSGSLFFNDEAAFMVLEGAMIILATAVLSVLHPGYAFSGKWGETGFAWGKKKSTGRKGPRGEDLMLKKRVQNSVVEV